MSRWPLIKVFAEECGVVNLRMMESHIKYEVETEKPKRVRIVAEKLVDRELVVLGAAIAERKQVVVSCGRWRDSMVDLYVVYIGDHSRTCSIHFENKPAKS